MISMLTGVQVLSHVIAHGPACHLAGPFLLSCIKLATVSMFNHEKNNKSAMTQLIQYTQSWNIRS